MKCRLLSIEVSKSAPVKIDIGKRQGSVRDVVV